MNRTPNLLICATIVCSSLILSPVSFSGDIYTWTDENGTQHFGARPPNGVRDFTLLKKGRYEEQEAETGTSAPAAAAPATRSPERAEKEVTEKPAASESGSASLQDEEAALNEQVRALNCKKARTVLKTLNENARVRVLNEKGEYEMLSPEQTDARRKDAEKIQAENC